MTETEQIRIEEWQGVDSSNVEAVAFQDFKLYVRFKGGAVYEYTDEALAAIPADEGEPKWNSASLGLYLAQADSVGSAFNRLIRANNVSTRRVDAFLVKEEAE